MNNRKGLIIKKILFTLIVFGCFYIINASTPLGEFGGATVSTVHKIHANNLETAYNDKIMIEFTNGQVAYFLNDSQNSASMLSLFMKAFENGFTVRYWLDPSFIHLPADNIDAHLLTWFQIVKP